MRPFVLDMETSDPDDFLTLLLLLGHPAVDLRAVTVTPGTRFQIGVVQWALEQLGRDIPVGAFNIDHAKDCVSGWHYTAFGMPKKLVDAAPGHEVLARTLGPGTTLVCGAALKNLGALMRRDDAPAVLGSAFVQGGFAGEGVVPPERQLEKFRGRVTCPTFNLNGDPESALRVADPAHRARFEDLRFVSKNVCHGVVYDRALHGRVTLALAALNHAGADPRWKRALELIVQGMSHYLAKHSSGKAFHDPLAACCAIDPSIGEWAEVTLYRERGEWGSRLSPGSRTRIITGYNHDRFVQTLLAES